MSAATPSRGWVAATLVMIAVIAAQLGVPRIFDGPRWALFDAYERHFPRIRTTTPVVIVAIDDASLAKIGQWPWPRQTLAELITDIQRGHPAALGVDITWPEPDKESPEQWSRHAGPLPPEIAVALGRLPTHDGLLAKALGVGRTAIGIVGLEDEGARPDTGILAPFRTIGGDETPPPGLPTFMGAQRSLPELDAAANGHGLLSVKPDADRVIRRMPLVSTISGRLAPTLDMEMLRLAAGAPWIDLYKQSGSLVGVGVGALKIPTGADGSVWIDYSAHDDERMVSAADVLAGHVRANAFDGTMVLIGITGLAIVDQQKTPVGVLPGAEIDAEFLETVVNGRLAQRPLWTWLAEPQLTAALGLLFIFALPRVRRPLQVALVFAPIALVLAGGVALWVWRRELVDVATPVIGASLVLGARVVTGLAEADAQRRRLRRELENRRVAEAKAEGELSAARGIQLGILPRPDSLAADPRVDISALMIPARQIGGDLYDFFKIDPHHLFFAIGDVSGKGVPASLFMAVGKSLAKSCALRGETNVGAIINQTNLEISRDNSEMMFITLFAGVLNLATGELQFCNAGHDAPFLLRSGDAPRALTGESGPPLCIIEDYGYATDTFAMRPGDRLCLITDGITEATNGQGALIGRDRVARRLGALAADADARTVNDQLDELVKTFVAGAEPFDDLTILTVGWRGAGANAG